MNLSESESESYVMTDGQSASLSWNRSPIWGLRPDLYYCQTVADLLMWSALSDERTGLLFTIAAGPRQRSHSRVRVPLDSRPYFTVSDSRLPFSSLPTTHRDTVEVVDTTSTLNPPSIFLKNLGLLYNCHVAWICHHVEQLIVLCYFVSPVATEHMSVSGHIPASEGWETT
jgi:hypothetical protein